MGYERGVDHGDELPGDESDGNEEEGDAHGVRGGRRGAHGQNKAAWRGYGYGETGNHIRMEGNRRTAAHGLPDALTSPIDQMRMAGEVQRGKDMRHVVQRSGCRGYMKVPTKNYVHTPGEGHGPREANIGAPGAHADIHRRIHQRNQHFPERQAAVVNDVAVYDESSSLVRA